MTNIHDEFFSPYQRYIFWPLWILSIAMTIVISGILYWVLATQQLNETREELQNIATKTAAFLPLSIHEKLIESENQKSDDYELLQLYLQSIMAGNPKIHDVFTVRVKERADIYEYIVSGRDTKDINSDNLIEGFEEKKMLGNEANFGDNKAFKAGLENPSSDEEITYNGWGAWLSGYAPMKGTENKTLAVVGVSYDAETLSDERQQSLLVIIYFNLILIIPYALMAYLISKRVNKPYKILSKAMNELSHGNFDHRLPFEGKAEEKIFSELFNNMAEMYENEIKNRTEKE